MSRVGKRPVAIPSGVTATVDGQTVKMKGPKGTLSFVAHDDVGVVWRRRMLDDGAALLRGRCIAAVLALAGGERGDNQERGELHHASVAASSAIGARPAASSSSNAAGS